jgi:RND family efflux transporter MFP subunit
LAAREDGGLIVRFSLVVGLALLALTPPAAALEVRGWLEWVHKVELRAVENGVVEDVPVNAGQHVRAGELLLRMDQRDHQAALLAARAQVARAKIQSQKAERELGRTQELYDRGLIAQEELRDAELQQSAALAEEEAAKAAEAAAEVALERTELRAPFDGIVVARNAWKGEVIYKTLQQDPLIVIAPDDKMLARALVTANVLRRFRPGLPAGVNVLGELRPGQVYSLGVEAVRVELQGAVYYLDVLIERRPGEVLRPSETVQIVFPELR